MKTIYILTLHNVRTGGPEALHQLSDALIAQGFDARMVYYDWTQIAHLEKAEPQSAYQFGLRANPIEEYARYKTVPTSAVLNEPGAVVVLPETLCHLAPKFDKATVLIWWLSVDNGFGALSKVNLNHLRKPGVRHAVQSIYAGELARCLFAEPFVLEDYTTDLTQWATPLPWEERAMMVVYNAHPLKVAHDMDALLDGMGVAVAPLRGMSRAKAAETLSRARVYLDLGSFPGKDRPPREASLMGCGVICADVGGAEYTFATHVDPNDRDEVIDAILDRLDHAPLIAVDPEEERREFFEQVRGVFGEL